MTYKKLILVLIIISCLLALIIPSGSAYSYDLVKLVFENSKYAVCGILAGPFHMGVGVAFCHYQGTTYILTCLHPVMSSPEDPSKLSFLPLRVEFLGLKPVEAKVLFFDLVANLMLLSAKCRPKQISNLAAGVEQGDTVIAISYKGTLSLKGHIPGTVTGPWVGRVVGFQRIAYGFTDVLKVIYSGFVLPEKGGSPLLNLRGETVGICGYSSGSAMYVTFIKKWLEDNKLFKFGGKKQSQQ